jgi:hypothetical protein
MKETFHCEVLWYFRGLIYGPPRESARRGPRSLHAPTSLRGTAKQPETSQRGNRHMSAKSAKLKKGGSE